MRSDYIDLERTFNRVNNAIKSVGDKYTVDDMSQIGFAIAEMRHASQSIKDGTPIEEVQDRLMKALFQNELANKSSVRPG